MNLYSEICILGTGPVARICSYYCKNIRHFIVGNSTAMGSLSKFKILDGEVNLVPIFPVYQSSLYEELWGKDNIKHNLLEYIHYGEIIKEFEKIQYLLSKAKPESYVSEHLRKGNSIETKKNIVLAYKLFGNIIFDKRLGRVCNKVNRHYEKKAPNARIGFINSLSPYYEKLQVISGGEFLPEEIKEIDIANKIIITTKSEIKYKRLISTMNLKEMMSKINKKIDIQLFGHPAFFYIFKTTICLHPDKVIYDLEIESPIYRIFIIDLNTIIVQLSYLESISNEDSQPITNRLKQIFGYRFTTEFEYKYSINDAYPIDSSSDIELNEYMKELEENDIVLIGRFSEWKYLDLHELNYSKII
ncbi:hypothetical protein [Capnocytophaga canis]|uniref:hypothetical protein n=1 Tax=Capnocytophaga canis TaxID=1848903 RepID=UPI001562C25E|nr:hypothetical protein [Capnocytophaga canis]